MSSQQDNIVRYIDEQLDAIAHAPEGWGPPQCVELQILQLLEFRSVTLRPTLEQKNPRAVLDAYDAFIARKFPDAPPAPLATLLEQNGRLAELLPLLIEFRGELVREMTPEDIFLTHDLVLTLEMQANVPVPRARALSSYYGEFHRVLRAVARTHGSRGRASRALEDAIDFSISDVRLTPANGAPAQITLPLDQLPSDESERVKHALEEIVTVNEWAACPDVPVATLRERLREPKEPQRLAAQVLRLMPSKEDAVKSVELGGRLIPRPVTIKPSYATRILEVIKEEEAPRSFDKVVSIRAVDMDQRSMRIRGDRKSFKCWIDEQLVDIARNSLGNRVRVIGQEYKRKVIIVREIKV